MLGLTENPDLVRRRGRWLSVTVMEIYPQEVEAVTYFPSLRPEARLFLEQMADSFPSVLASAQIYRCYLLF